MDINVAILYLRRESKHFTKEEKEDLCENCRRQDNNDKHYSPFAEDTGECSRCGSESDLINRCIADLLITNHIDIEDYYQCGGPRIYQNI
ncbi:TPA: hypothetical protein ACGZ9U_003516 [Elizabethkingia anophelis]